ncbi:hypothetical protein BOX15_Mlig006937g3 [Macrostomum lignano]|uniref:Tetraspanin n=2 Tax=Macrostomum lignano TaxID=282301 RepID=A0A267DUX2_9PLAT|nr:hypothetical protein BOX15_Mlig006937g3 [Macrostomum lignano]
MLLAGQIVCLLALINLVIGIICVVSHLADFGSWTQVIEYLPIVTENPRLLTILKVAAYVYLATGLLQLVASCTNDRILWSCSLICQCALFGFSIFMTVFIFKNNMRTKDFLQHQLISLYGSYNKSHVVAEFLDNLHVVHHCCGYQSDHAEWRGLIGPNRVPDSCCHTSGSIHSNEHDHVSEEHEPMRSQGCGYNNQSVWLSRLHNAACQSVLWGLYEPMDPLAQSLLLLLVYVSWLGVLFNFYKVFLAFYLAIEVGKYLRSMDALAD